MIVFGDSSAAVFLISQLLKREEEVVWAKGTGARLMPVMPYLKSELALGAMLDSYSVFSDEILAQPVEKGCFHRVFKKGFKLPPYMRSSNVDAQLEAFNESVWKPEQLNLGTSEFRIRGVSPAMAEDFLRKVFETHPSITHLSVGPIVELEIYEHGGEVQFASGLKTKFKQFYYCDSIQELKHLPKLGTVMKHQMGSTKSANRMSALQVVFSHKDEMPYPQDTGFVIPMNRDAGEEFDRDVLGYFTDSKRSVWTVFMKVDETEENHEIMKKLRKLKQSLNRAFGAETDSATEFSRTVEKEQVRFESAFLVIDNHSKPSDSNADFVLMTDSFGFSHALETLANLFSIPAMEFETASADAQSNAILEDMPTNTL